MSDWVNGKAKVSDEVFIKAMEECNEIVPDMYEYFVNLGITLNKTSIYRRIDSIKKKNKKDVNKPIYKPTEKLEMERLKSKVTELRNDLKEAQRQATASSDIKSLIYQVQKHDLNTEPEVVVIKDTEDETLIPVLFLTDIHFGEVVNSREVGSNDDYTTQLAKEHLHQVVDDYINICVNNLSNYQYNRFVLLLGGDLITNDLHDLAETNDDSPTRQVITMVEEISKVIGKLSTYFDEVDVFAVSGNHGRLDGKNRTKTKGRVDNSLEHLGYYFIDKQFMDNPNVNFFTSDSDELLFELNGHRFNLQHGDRFKGGNGIGGIHVPINRAKAKMMQTANALDTGFDTLVIGHFHQHYVGDGLIIGNSLKPYDEYCKAFNIPYSEAGATSWFMNKHGDICFATNLKIRQDKSTKKNIVRLGD